ncbi:exodeoxyribonuclease V subunit gamma [Pigmentiphaga soli]|uniref:RecBCD enzyme subunit RecC n=1 Tax=Pigmentiphaga soli TaxID=1007095 RepID=A0ABP8H848_9BURK
MPAETLAPGFMVVHGNRLEDLRNLAVAWMQRYPLGPLESETVLVQSNGIAQWFKLALAADPDGADGQGCGIAAAVDVQLPARFLWRAYRAVLGRQEVPDTSPLDRDGLTWRLMRLLPELAQQPPFAPLRRFLSDDGNPRKLYQLAERLADLFDQYQVYRADWLADWAAGRDRLRVSRGGQRPLAEREAWQPALWRALQDDLGDRAMRHGRVGVHRRFVDALRAGGRAPAGLARRVIVFGISSMPAQTLEALAAMASCSQVLLCVHNPSRHHWADIVADQDLLRQAYRRQQRKPGAPPPATGGLAAYGHPLLAAWGKQGRDYISLLDSYDAPDDYRHRFAPVGERIDLFAGGPADTLLGQLQDDILELRTLEETRQRWAPVDPRADRSLRFHVAHSAQREVEILHDQLLDRFNADPSLRPRDVIVMVPDIDAYAPHIRAVFGLPGPADPRFIPFTLADQGRRGNAPLLRAVDYLLRLPDSRFAASELLDLLDVAAVRRRFGIDEADLPQLHRWIQGAGVRWGLDAGQRASLGLPAGQEQNTWRFGLRRMLLGYAAGPGADFDGIEPYGEVGGLEAETLGPLAALVDTLDALRARLAQPAPPAQWGLHLRALLAAMFAAADDTEATLLAELEEQLDTWLAQCEAAGLEAPLPLVVVREAWLAGLDGRRLNQRFLAGAVNFCTLMPMRAIPFRIVCLLGMNDGDYPRLQPPLDFDLMAGDYRPGDRSRREDDRYLLLEALLSAREQLYVSWVGRSIRDNGERSPSVLVAQLRDHVAAGWRQAGPADTGQALLAAITVEHPLQPFSARYFRDGDDPRLFSYAREWQALHEPHGMRVPVAPPAGAIRPPLPDGVELETLQSFLADPVRHYFEQSLSVHFDADGPAAEDDEPFGLDGLDSYRLAESLFEAARDADDPDAALRARAARLQRSGELPVGGFGERRLEALIDPVRELLARYRERSAARAPAPPLKLDLPLPEAGLRLQGWVDGIRGDGGDPETLHAIVNGLFDKNGRPRWHRLLRAWVAQLAANAAGCPLATAFVSTDGALTLPPLDAVPAHAALSALACAWLQGRAAPLPVAPRAACAWLDAGGSAKAGLPGGPEQSGSATAADGAAGDEAARRAARIVYDDGARSTGEGSRNPYLCRQYPCFDDLWAEGAFADWAQRLYGPLVEQARRALDAGRAR